MNKIHDLEIRLSRRGRLSGEPNEQTEYLIHPRSSRPDSAADTHYNEGIACFPWNDLLFQVYDPQNYGQILANSLFSDPKVIEALHTAQASAEADQAGLRLRLMIEDADELHSLNWETLCDPQDGSLLTTNENLPFSRYMSSRDLRPVALRSKSVLHALVVVANPTNLSEYNLAPINVDKELESAQISLKGITVDSLAAKNGLLTPTLNNIFKCLRSTSYDLVYLVCHGKLAKSGPTLWLEDEGGKTDLVSGIELAIRFRELKGCDLPRLAVLAACQSAGEGNSSYDPGKEDEDEVRVALGPLLIDSGIPAVVAMNGRINEQTVTDFMPVFFAELLKDGRIDRAMAVARGIVREHPDFWMPVLFMRLKDGAIWYEPSFRDKEGHNIEFGKWDNLSSKIEDGHCTVFLGSGLFETEIMCSYREIAMDLAKEYGYPLSPHEMDSLPQVAQFLSINEDREFLLNKLRKNLQYRIKTDLSEILGGTGNLDKPLEQLITLAGVKLRQDKPNEPYRLLAKLPLKVYITSDFHSLMADALIEAGRQPVIEALPWNEELVESYQGNSIFCCEPNYRPSEERPLVYHLFGLLSQPESLVLTEDDHFEFLKGAVHNNALIPGFVQRAMADSALLFLGYQLEDWSFRMLLRSILDQPGNKRLNKYSHVAVQLVPEVGKLISTEQALNYLKVYLNKSFGTEFSMYLGSAEEFLKMLSDKMSLAGA